LDYERPAGAATALAKKYQDAKGCIVVFLNRVLYGCVESAALWYENLRDTMSSLGYERNPHDNCVFNKTGKQGLQCTATVHVDDLLITSVDESMIESLAVGLRLRYGEITKSDGTTLNYLGMVLDNRDNSREPYSNFRDTGKLYNYLIMMNMRQLSLESPPPASSPLLTKHLKYPMRIFFLFFSFSVLEVF
jgi:Reverse transcriptase (RNA-dependent DNA polymerase)